MFKKKFVNRVKDNGDEGGPENGVKKWPEDVKQNNAQNDHQAEKKDGAHLVEIVFKHRFAFNS
jgi:hypothetical protein